MSTINVEELTRSRAILGECPTWNAGEGVLYWTDVFGQVLHRYAPATGVDSVLPLTERLNSFGFRKDGGLVAGAWKGFGFVDLGSGAVERIWDLPAEQPGFFLNDGKSDRAGRYWAATVCEAYDRPGAGLYRLDPDASYRRVADGAFASNGLAFSPDDRTLYYADSVEGLIWAFDFDLGDGTVANRRIFARCHRPDGATVDTLGRYWVASFGKGEVLCFGPDGRLDRRVQLPTTQTVMCAFGGSRLDTLFVTTGTFRLSDEASRQQTSAGSLFAITGLGAQGIPEPFFLG